MPSYQLYHGHICYSVPFAVVPNLEKCVYASTSTSSDERDFTLMDCIVMFDPAFYLSSYDDIN